MNKISRPHSLRVEQPSYCNTPSERTDLQLEPVKVGCLHTNLGTARGRIIFMLQMLVLCFIPHAALVAQNCAAMSQLALSLDSSLSFNNEVNSTLSLGEAIVSMLRERLVVNGYLFGSLSCQPHQRSKVEYAFSMTDFYLRDVPGSLLKERYKSAL